VDHLTPAGQLLGREKHYFYGSPSATFFTGANSYPNYSDGREYKTEILDSDGATVLRRVENDWQQGCAVSLWSNTVPNNPNIADTTSTLEPTGANQVSKQTFDYDCYNNPTDTYEYDYGAGSPATNFTRHTHTDYLTTNPVNGAAYDVLNPNSTSPDINATFHIRNLPVQQSVYDVGGVERARTSYEYDNYASDTNHAVLQPRSGISGLCTIITSPAQCDNSNPSGFVQRGNATGTTKYLLVNGSVTGSVSAFVQFDVAGNVFKAIDARGSATTMEYDDRFGAPDGEARSNSAPSELAGLTSYAFATRVTNALGQVAYGQFDYYLGRPVDGEDANGVVSSGYYNDPLDRPTQVVRAANQDSSVKSQTTFSYDDANHIVTSTSDQNTFNDPNPLKSQVVYDAMGRTIESRKYEGGSNYIVVQTQYDALSRAYKVSNPFRPWQSESALWTTSVFDALSRVTSITTADNAVVTTSYSGNTVIVTDQTSKQRKSVTDALGRLTQVYEDPGGLNYQTIYSYDALDDLTLVTQDSQTRTFVYDSLKRLTSAASPESGAVSYQYDNNGNLTQKTDARGVVTTFAPYDVLNRPTTRSYSDGTPSVTYAYDSATNGKGRLASVSSSVSTYSYSSYDALGRALSGGQTLGSQTYSLSYSYDLAGHMKGITYPSGHVVNYNYDGAGRLGDKDAFNLAFTGNLGDGSTRTYSTGINYSPFGGMTTEQFGTSTAVYNKLFYDSRGQLSEIRDSTTSPMDTSWNRGAIINHYSNNCWGMCGGSNSTTSMTDNNGNLKKQEVYIPNDDQSYDNYAQFYDYDSLNRLSSVRENKFGGAVNWQQAYLYDRWGNRTIDQTNTWGSGIPKPNFGVDTSTNRLTAPGGYTMTYDSAGNLTFDNSDGIGGTRTYDAENRMKQAWANSQWQTYTYDGDGKRVKRIINGTETWQVFGLGGELIAEYAANGSASSPQKEYGYRNGQLLVTAEPSAQIHWLVTDQLGTPRMILDLSGNLNSVSRHDYLPFGEELYAGIDGRLTTQGYTGDNVRQKFTQKERDNETGLDYFEARYYASMQGRFTTADPFTLTPARVLDPQQLNLYAYVRNNPLVHIDPTGMIIDTGRLDEDELRRWQKVVDLANAKDKDGNYLNPKLHEEYDRLNNDERTFFIENHDFGSKFQDIGEFKITKFKGANDFSEAVIQLDFKKLKNIEGPVAADLVPGFKKFDKLFGVKNDAILRLAELFGHEGAHSVFALDDVAGAVKLQQQLNERDAALNALPKGKGRYPFPPDLIQKMNAADKALIPTERYAQQVEKIINGELRATSKRKK
jgi:RHS repeat-associated protein